jgi:hypothetical protein
LLLDDSKIEFDKTPIFDNLLVANFYKYLVVFDLYSAILIDTTKEYLNSESRNFK